jgi:hypothetical protein
VLGGYARFGLLLARAGFTAFIAFGAALLGLAVLFLVGGEAIGRVEFVLKC